MPLNPHGGRRKGSGQKRKPPSDTLKRVTIALSPKEHADLKHLCDTTGRTRRDILKIGINFAYTQAQIKRMEKQQP